LPNELKSTDSGLDNIPKGIGWMILTMALFVSMDAIAKYLMQSFSIVQVIWARFFIHTLWVLLFMSLCGGIQISSQRYSLQIVRSLLLFTVTIFFFLGVREVQLATAAVMMYLAPIMVTILAIPLLKESVGIRRWIGVIVGFVGALITVRPGMSDFEMGMVFLLMSATCHAFYLIATRKIRAYDNPLTTLFYTGIAGAVIMSFIVPFFWITPNLQQSLWFVAMGFVGSASHFCLIRAFRSAPASVVAPFSYSSLIWSISLGYLVFNELPDRWVLLGGFVIIASGLYIFYREQLNKNISV
jgi:drug/metabolite transporter (DMT)-like permease